MKKAKYLMLIMTIALQMFSWQTSAAATSGFSDIAASPYKDAILYVSSKGVIQGYSDGTYRPDAQINRAEFAKIVMASTHGTDLSTYVVKACFSDVPVSAWYSKYVCLGHEKGIIGGYPDLTFKPAQNINAAEALKITLSAFFGNSGNISEVSGTNWYDKYLNFSEKYFLKPAAWTNMSQNITRGEMAQFIYKILSPQSPQKITVTTDSTQLVPFSIITLTGSGINPLAATSVIFTTSNKQVFTVPALYVSNSAIEVGVPPVNYNAAQGSFGSATVSVKVIQATDNYSAFAVVTSNQMNGLTITAPLAPSVYSSVAAQVPKGSISVSFLAASLQSLQNAQASLPNGVSSNDLTKAENGIQTVMNALKTFSQNPSAPVTLANADGSTTTLQPADIAQLDAIYLGLLGELESRKIVAYVDGNWAFLPLAHAQNTSRCSQEGLADGSGNNAAMVQLYAEGCQFADAAQNVHDKAAPLMPEALKFVYTIPLQVSSVMFDAVAEGVIGLAKVGQLVAASAYALVTDTLVNGNVSPTKALEAIGESTLDGKFSVPSVPLFGVTSSSLEFFRKVNEAMKPDAQTKGQATAIVINSNDTSTVKFLETGTDGKSLVSVVNTPAAASSNLQKKAGFEITQPTPPPAAIQPPAGGSTGNNGNVSVCSDQYHQCYQTSNCGAIQDKNSQEWMKCFAICQNSMDSCMGLSLSYPQYSTDQSIPPVDTNPQNNPPADVNPPADSTPASGTINFACAVSPYSVGNSIYYNVHVTGTASGPVGASMNATNPVCQQWTDCVRQSGEPATTTWTEESQAEGTVDHSYAYDGDLQDGQDFKVKSGVWGAQPVILGTYNQHVCD